MSKQKWEQTNARMKKGRIEKERIEGTLQAQHKEDRLKQTAGINITGTELGQDKDTQITTLITGNVISFRRFVEHKARLDIEGGGSYTIMLIQNGVVNQIKVNGGGDSQIMITQGS